VVRREAAGRELVSRRRCVAGGFTLLELLVVMTLIGILAAIAIPAVVQYPIRAKEAVLRTNLRTLRDALEQFYGDKGHYPAALDELVPKYVKVMPTDPFTKKNTTWVPVLEEESEGGDEVGPPPEEGSTDGPGILDVHSAATGVGLDGVPYKEW
jgi:general secretion pathway protein G